MLVFYLFLNLLLGAGIGTIHYSGMSAIPLEGVISPFQFRHYDMPAETGDVKPLPIEEFERLLNNS